MLACQEFQWNSCLSFLTLTLCKKIGFWPSCWPIFLGVAAADGYVHSNFYSSLEFILWWPKSYNSISFLTWHYYFWIKFEVLPKKKYWFWSLFTFFRYVQPRDAGMYECQVSTEPKLSHFVHLNIIGLYYWCISSINCNAYFKNTFWLQNPLWR